MFKTTTHNLPQLPPFVPDESLENLVITEDEVGKELRNINTSKAPGPDELPSHVLKTCAQSLTAPITTLFNKSFQQGEIPTDWKKANVVPIHKKGPKTDPTNYHQL